MNKLVIGWMYPDVLNLHGERGSIQALERIANNLGIDAQVVRIDFFTDKIEFDKLDMLVFLPGEIKVLNVMRNALRTQEEELRSYVENGGTVIAIGTSGLIFGKEIVRLDGSIVKGFELLDLVANEKEYIWGDDLHFRLLDNKMELVGSQVSMADVETDMPIGETLYGRGNNGTGAEGARYNNLIYTNCLGPLFVKNPWFGEQIIKDIVLRKVGVTQVRPHTLPSKSFDTTLRFIETKK